MRSRDKNMAFVKQGNAVARRNKGYLREIIEKSSQDLHHRVDMQQHLLLTIMGEMKDRPPVDICTLVDCRHRRLLRQVLTETIEVLEETKKAFKSKRLEGLRKRLMDVLREAA
jgi:hypothetical protein